MAVISFKFGMPRQQKIGLWSKNVVHYGRPSQGVLPLAPVVQALTDNQILTLPVNCVTISEQRQPNKRAIGLEGLPSSMRGIFRE